MITKSTDKNSMIYIIYKPIEVPSQFTINHINFKTSRIALSQKNIKIFLKKKLLKLFNM